MAIKILIADDHALLRQGIKRVLNFEEDLEVVGEAEDGQETLARTLVLQPDILLLDLNMPGLSGLEVTRQLQAAKSRTKIIVLTIHDSDNYVLELLKNGALGYLLKDVEPTMLIKAIHVVNEGNAFVYPKLAERIFGGLSESDDVNEKAREMLDRARQRSEQLVSESYIVKEAVEEAYAAGLLGANILGSDFSFHLYNTVDEVDTVLDAVRQWPRLRELATLRA